MAGLSRLPRKQQAAAAARRGLVIATLLLSGVLLVSLRGSQIDLMHMLFGSVLAVDDAALLMIATVSSLTLWVLALMYGGVLLVSLLHRNVRY